MMNNSGIDWSDGGPGDPPPPPGDAGATARPKRPRHTSPSYWSARAQRACDLLATNAGPGRPVKLTGKRLSRLLAAIATGDTLKTACNLAGIRYSTMWRWYKRGEDKESGFLQFCNLINKALALAESSLRKAIAEDPSWTSKAWLLERRNPADYGRRTALDIEMRGQIEHKHSLDTGAAQLPRVADLRGRLAQLHAMLETFESPGLSAPGDRLEDATNTIQPTIDGDYTEVGD